MSALGRRLARLPVGFAAAVALLGLLYLAVHVLLPFYRVWGLDGAAVQGVLAIAGGDRPAPTPWPGLGMYLVLGWAAWAAHALGFVSFLRWSDVTAAADPLPGVLELAGFLRLVSVAAILALVLGLHVVLRSAVRTLDSRGRLPVRLLAGGLLLALGVQEGLLYHASMVRPELYALAGWALGLAAALWAAGRPGGWLGLAGFWVAGGLLASALLTDPAMLGLVAWTPAFVWVARESGWTRSAALRPVPASSHWALARAGAPAVAMLALLALAAPGAGRGVAPSTSAAAVVLLLAAPALLVASTGRRLAAAEGTAAGFVLGFLAPFALYRDPARSWAHLLADVRALFLDPVPAGEGSGIVTDGAAPALLLASVALAAWAVLRAMRHGERGLAVAVGTATVVLLGVTAGPTPGPWDLARRSAPLLLWSLALGIQLLPRRAAGGWRGVPALALGGLLLVPVADQVHRAARIGDRLDPALGHRAARLQAWVDPGALTPEERYALSISERFDPGAGEERRRIAARHAMLWPRIRQAVAQAVVSQPADLRHVGALTGDFPLPGQPGARRVLGEPEALTAAVTVRPARWAARSLRLADRPGLRVFYFADEALVASRPVPEGLHPTRLRVAVSADGGARRYRGYRVIGSTEVPVGEAAWADGFVVVQEWRGEDDALVAE